MKIDLKFLLIPIIAVFGPIMSFSIFLIFFYKSGFILAPFIPSESIFFLSGTFAARGYSNISMLFLVFTASSMLVGIIYYWLGTFVGPRIFKYETSRIFKKKYIERMHYFYDKYGSNTILVSRFIPVIKSFIPFFAGIGKMNFLKFLVYNMIGAMLWVGIFVFGGYYFAKIPLIKNNFSLMIEIIIIGSFILVISNMYRYFKKKDGALDYS